MIGSTVAMDAICADEAADSFDGECLLCALGDDHSDTFCAKRLLPNFIIKMGLDGWADTESVLRALSKDLDKAVESFGEKDGFNLEDIVAAYETCNELIVLPEGRAYLMAVRELMGSIDKARTLIKRASSGSYSGGRSTPMSPMLDSRRESIENLVSGVFTEKTNCAIKANSELLRVLAHGAEVKGAIGFDMVTRLLDTEESFSLEDMRARAVVLLDAKLPDVDLNRLIELTSCEEEAAEASVPYWFATLHSYAIEAKEDLYRDLRDYDEKHSAE